MTRSPSSSRPRNSLLVLGVDTSLRSTGLGLVECVAGRMRGVAYDLVRNPPGLPLSAALLNIRSGVASALDEFKPDVVAVEGIFFARYPRAALLLGHARGVVISCCAASGLPVYEHEPRRVKQAVAGYGGATKNQMQRMVESLLGLSSEPPEDAADALAIAICHIHDANCPELSSARPL